MLWFPFHACSNKPGGYCCVIHRQVWAGSVCPVGAELEAARYPNQHFFQLGSSPRGKQGERMDKHLHFREILKVTDPLVTLLRA